MYPYNKAKAAYTNLMGAVQSTKDELVLQRSNHLKHIQAEGEKQTALLGKTTELLENIRLELAEQTGFLRASAPLRAGRARAKK